MPQLDCAAVLFDLDGVLIDSTPCVTRVWRQWAMEHGLNPDEVVHIAHGRRSIETVRIVTPQLDAELENQEIEGREIADTEGITVFDGAADLLRSLPPTRWTIVTSGTRPLATKRLQVAGLPIPERMVTGNDVVNGKPHPEPYLRGAEMLGVPIEECVVLEDAPSGIRAAKAAGASVLAVPTTYPREELSHATDVLDTLKQLKAERVSSGGQIRLEW